MPISELLLQAWPMQRFWVRASRALSLVARELGGEYPAMLAICQRAHAGLIESRADLVLFGNTRNENATIPAEFWWAEGHEALDQDWSRGDFGTWINREVQARAFGVQFDFEGLRKLIAPERAADAFCQLSVGSDPAWIAARDAQRFIYEKVGLNPVSAGPALLDQCRLGFVTGRAQLMQMAISSADNWTSQEREWDVPQWFWQNFTNAGSSSQDWARGVFRGKGKTPQGTRYITLTGVFFGRASVEALADQPESKPTPPSVGSSPNKGGRPRKEWWDEFWCGVWGQIVHGEFTPKTQADVERAMLDWVSDRGESVAESTIRPMARKLFVEWEREGKN